jgi:hypothetical protein
MLTFIEWVSQLQEGFLTPQQSEGDLVCFGVHDLDGRPIDVKKMRHCISPIQSVGKGHVLVERPQKTRHRGMKKMMSKDGNLLKIPTGSLHKVPGDMVNGSDSNVFLYMPGKYHRGLAGKADRKMMSAGNPMTGQPPVPPQSKIATQGQTSNPVISQYAQSPQQVPPQQVPPSNPGVWSQGQNPYLIPGQPNSVAGRPGPG